MLIFITVDIFKHTAKKIILPVVYGTTLSVCTNPGKNAVVSMFVRGVDFVSGLYQSRKERGRVYVC